MSLGYQTLMIVIYVVSGLIYSAGLISLWLAIKKFPRVSAYWILPMGLLLVNMAVLFVRSIELKQYEAFVEGVVYTPFENLDGVNFITYKRFSDLRCDKLCQELLTESHVEYVTMSLEADERDIHRTYHFLPSDDCTASPEICIAEVDVSTKFKVKVLRHEDMNRGPWLPNLIVRPNFRIGILIFKVDTTKPEITLPLAVFGKGYHKVPVVPLLVNPFKNSDLTPKFELWNETVPSHNFGHKSYVPVFEDSRIRNGDLRQEDMKQRQTLFEEKYFQILNETLGVNLDGRITYDPSGAIAP